MGIGAREGGRDDEMRRKKEANVMDGGVLTESEFGTSFTIAFS